MNIPSDYKSLSDFTSELSSYKLINKEEGAITNSIKNNYKYS